jgi:RecA/RadA recombinase
MSSLLDKLKAAGSIKSETIAESSFFKPKDIIQTAVPIINCAFTGSLDGGLVSGLTCIAGPSRHFKSNLGLVAIKAYMSKYKDSICLFYDSEFGITPEYLAAHGIDMTRVIHLPIEHIEQLKFDLVKKLEEIKKSDKVIIFIDSIGNLASKKEVEDANDGKSVADMTRAKSMKSLFRIITPHLTLKDIPCIVINHTYETQEMYSKQVVSGGTGVMYSSNNVWIIGRSQEKDGTELVGYSFTINIEKSRFVKEKSKLKFLVKFDGGIDKYSGLLDLALDSGHVKKPSNGWYSRVDTETGVIEDKKWREADTHNKEFWRPILGNQEYLDFVKNTFQLAVTPIQFAEEDE